MKNFLLGVFLTSGIVGTSAYAIDCCTTGDKSCCSKQMSCCKGNKMSNDKVSFIKFDNKNTFALKNN